MGALSRKDPKRNERIFKQDLSQKGESGALYTEWWTRKKCRDAKRSYPIMDGGGSHQGSKGDMDDVYKRGELASLIATKRAIQRERGGFSPIFKGRTLQ